MTASRFQKGRYNEDHRTTIRTGSGVGTLRCPCTGLRWNGDPIRSALSREPRARLAGKSDERPSRWPVLVDVARLARTTPAPSAPADAGAIREHGDRGDLPRPHVQHERQQLHGNAANDPADTPPRSGVAGRERGQSGAYRPDCSAGDHQRRSAAPVGCPDRAREPRPDAGCRRLAQSVIRPPGTEEIPGRARPANAGRRQPLLMLS